MRTIIRLIRAILAIVIAVAAFRKAMPGNHGHAGDTAGSTRASPPRRALDLAARKAAGPAPSATDRPDKGRGRATSSPNAGSSARPRDPRPQSRPPALFVMTKSLTPPAFCRYIPAMKEERIVALGWLNHRLHVLCFKQIAGGIRVISFRKANDREVKSYEQATLDRR